METYGQRVAMLRDELDWTQQDLADRIGIPLRTLQDIESGKTRRPQRKTRERIDDALGMLSPGAASEDYERDIQVFLDLQGAFLHALPEDERTAYIRADITRMAQWNR